MVHSQLGSLFAATASRSITSPSTTGGTGPTWAITDTGHARGVRGINLEKCSSPTAV